MLTRSILATNPIIPSRVHQVCWYVAANSMPSRGRAMDILLTRIGADTLAGPYNDIAVDVIAKELDYEGELTVIIGKDVKNLKPEDDPLEHVLGFTVGNDLSSRFWQWPQVSGSQHGYAKSFDNFGPIGPVIASRTAIPDPESLELRTWVNGEIRQDAKTDDLIFGIGAIIRHLSQCTTLRKGTVIMTGTPR